MPNDCERPRFPEEVPQMPRPAREDAPDGQADALDEARLIEETGSIRPQDARHLIHCLTIIGQVEGHYVLSPQDKTTKYEHILPALVAVEQDRRVEGLLILLNTVGGDVDGVPLAVSAKRSYIAPSASMTVHPVRVSGLLLGVPQSFDYLGRIQERICTFITQHSRIAPDHLRRLMSETGELATDVGSVLSGEQAVACGLIDRLGGLSDAIEGLYEMIETSPRRYA